MSEIRDVHTSHCCAIHMCKYNDSDCTVVTKKALQEYLCEDCQLDREEKQPLQDVIDSFINAKSGAATVDSVLRNLQDELIKKGFLHRDPPLQDGS